VKKIALEEHFLCPGLDDYWKATVEDINPDFRDRLLARLFDFGEMRLAGMDQAGIARAVLSISGPGVQAERNTQTAIHKAREANDALAREVQKRPDRYSGFAHLAMQDAKAAADELERCMRELKFCGAMINGHTNGQYLDHPSLHPFWERAEALDAPIYVHPTDPVSPSPALDGHKGLRRATWEWGFETGSHALRLVFGGLFDRFPRAQPGARPSRGDAAVPAVAVRQPRQALRREAGEATLDYIRSNIFVTTSGMCSPSRLPARSARSARPRDVCGRLSVRGDRRGGALHRHGGSRR
jgi:2,3-dihydroxybenzoate decarboxylase